MASAVEGRRLMSWAELAVICHRDILMPDVPHSEIRKQIISAVSVVLSGYRDSEGGEIWSLQKALATVLTAPDQVNKLKGREFWVLLRLGAHEQYAPDYGEISEALKSEIEKGFTGYWAKRFRLHVQVQFKYTSRSSETTQDGDLTITRDSTCQVQAIHNKVYVIDTPSTQFD